MATIRAYTTVEQSRKLAEILPLESADMTYRPIMDIDSMSNSGFLNTPECYPFNEFKNSTIKPLPCWSLAALLDVLLKGANINTLESINALGLGYYCWNQYDEIYADNPVDACYEMVLKLHKLKLL